MNVMPAAFNRAIAARKTAKPVFIKGGLTKLHYNIIDDLFRCGLKEDQVNAKYGLSPGVLRKWLLDSSFEQELRSRMHAAWSEARIKLARFAPEAANTLIELAKCEKEETRRKACLDVIAMLLRECSGESKDNKVVSLSNQPEPTLPPLPFSEKTASELLAVIAAEVDADDSDDRHDPEPPAAKECHAG